jgi:GT2 family glycosyltransferase
VPVAVSAAVINYNGQAVLKGCLDSLLGQLVPPAEIVVIDNRSTDQSTALVRETFPDVRLIQLSRNMGYGGAANVAVRETRSGYLMLLNPDVVLTPTFLAELVGFGEARPRAGSLTGKLLRFPDGPGRPIIDSTGHLLFRNRWAANRGEGERDAGQYDVPMEVFGVSGAAPFYRREMLEDVRIDGEVFPESFFLYLEDVDLDWRARLRGWKAYCVPTAVGYHERGSKSGVRSRDPAVLRHSLKNRYLMMIRNDSLGDLLLDARAIFPMEALRALDFLRVNPHALKGYLDVARLFPRTLRQRREIRHRARVSRREIRHWLRRDSYRRRLLERIRMVASRRSSPIIGP